MANTKSGRVTPSLSLRWLRPWAPLKLVSSQSPANTDTKEYGGWWNESVGYGCKTKNALPEELGEWSEPREADRGKAELGGLPPVLLGEPGGKLSATDISAAIGL